ncbi:MAG: replication initiation protein [Hyphomicrobiales bacterium]
MSEISVRSVLLNPFQNDKPLTPAMVLSLWVIADAVDKLKLSSGHDHTVELTIPTSRLRGTEGRSDNAWLKVCLDRMTGLKIGGTYRGQEWGAVMLAEWRLEEGGTIARLFLPPSAIHALRAGDTFAKIETHAAYRLQGHARTLYGALSDKKRMGNKYWVFELDELRYLLNVGDKKSYKRFNNFRQWVLDPAIDQINDFGTVAVSMTPQKVGRSIVAVRFDWQWKSISDARETDEENERVAMARRKADIVRDMPPLSDDLVDSDRPKLSAEERAKIAKDALKNTPFAR